jgi:hypothetical protein
VTYLCFTEDREGGNVSGFCEGDLEPGATYLYVSGCTTSFYLWTSDDGAHCGTEYTDNFVLHAPGHCQVHPYQQVRAQESNGWSKRVMWYTRKQKWLVNFSLVIWLVSVRHVIYQGSNFYWELIFPLYSIVTETYWNWGCFIRYRLVSDLFSDLFRPILGPNFHPFLSPKLPIFSPI